MLADEVERNVIVTVFRSTLSLIITDTSVKGRSLRLCSKGVVARKRLAG